MKYFRVILLFSSNFIKCALPSLPKNFKLKLKIFFKILFYSTFARLIETPQASQLSRTGSETDSAYSQELISHSVNLTDITPVVEHLDNPTPGTSSGSNSTPATPGVEMSALTRGDTLERNPIFVSPQDMSQANVPTPGCSKENNQILNGYNEMRIPHG